MTKTTGAAPAGSPTPQRISPQKLADSSLDVICALDAAGRFVEVSAAAKTVWGYTPEELKGRDYLDLVLEEDRSLSIQTAAAIRNGMALSHFENRYICRDGSVKPISWSARWDVEDGVMYCVARDASAIREAKRMAEAHEEKMLRAYKLAGIGWWEWDVASNRYVASDELFQLYGLSRESEDFVTIETFMSMVHPRERERVKKKLSDVGDNEVVQFGHWFNRADGKAIYLEHNTCFDRDANGHIIRVHGTTKDITYLRKAQLARRKSRQQTAAILDSIGDAFFAIDRKWKVSYWNRIAEQSTGVTKKEALGRYLFDVFPSKEDRRFEQYYTKAFENNENISFELYYDDTDRWFEFRAYPSIAGLSVYFREVTRRKKREEEWKVLNERFELVYKATHDAIWDWDLQTGQCYFNESFHQLFGYGQLQAQISDIWSNNIHPHDRDRVMQSINAAILDPQQLQWSGEYRFIRLDGAVADVLDRGFLMRDGEGKAIRMVGSMQDITVMNDTRRKLERSERRFRTMVQSGKDFVVLLNKQFEVTYISPNHQHTSGFTGSDVKGMSATEWVHPDDKEMVLREMLQIRNEVTVSLSPYRIRTKAGEYRWMETTLTNRLSDPNIEAIIVNSRDVSLKKAANDKLKKLSLVAKETHNAVVIADPASGIVWANKSFTDLCELPLEAMLGKQPHDVLQFDERNISIYETLMRQISEAQSASCELYLTAPSGRSYWFDIKGQPILDEKGGFQHGFFIGTDITSRKAAEAAIQASEKKYRQLFYKSPMPKWAFSRNDLRFLEVNDAAVQLYGYSRNEFLQMSIKDVRPSQEVERLEEILQLNRDNAGAFQSQVVHRKKDGTEILVEVTCFPVELGEEWHNIVEVRDLTETARLQQQIVEEKIAHQKEVAKAIINTQEKERSEIGKELHDNVNQILTTAKLYIENIDYYPEQGKLFAQKSRELVQQSINEIRYLSKQLVTPVLNDIGFSATIDELIAHYCSLNLFKIKFNYDLGDRVPEREMQLTIYRIIQEQLNNTVKYAQASTVSVSLTRSNDVLRLQINDDGVGFDPVKVSKGLGLNNIRNRAEVFKGQLQLSAAEGRGCSLEVCFPV